MSASVPNFTIPGTPTNREDPGPTPGVPVAASLVPAVIPAPAPVPAKRDLFPTNNPYASAKRAAVVTFNLRDKFNFHHYSNALGTPKFTQIITWAETRKSMEDLLGKNYSVSCHEELENHVTVDEIDFVDDNEEDDLNNVVANVYMPSHLNHTVSTLFGKSLHALDIIELNSVSGMFRNGLQLSTRPISFIGSPHSMKARGLGVNIDFFMEHIEYRTNRDGTTKKFLSVALGIPNWSVTDNDLTESITITNQFGQGNVNIGPVMKVTDGHVRFLRAMLQSWLRTTVCHWCLRRYRQVGTACFSSRICSPRRL
jgi:hypothetical protein